MRILHSTNTKQIALALLITAQATPFTHAQPIPTQTTLLWEDFEGGSLPAGWQVRPASTCSGQPSWQVGTGPNLSSQYFSIANPTYVVAVNDDGNNCNRSAGDTLLFPQINAAGINQVYLRMWLQYYNACYQGKCDHLYIILSTDGGTTWQIIDSIQQSYNLLATDETHLYYDLSPYVANTSFILGFVYTDDNGWVYGVAIDDVLIYEPLTAEVLLEDFTINKPWYAQGDAPTVTLTVRNIGASTITSMDINILSFQSGTATQFNDYSVTITPLQTVDITLTANNTTLNTTGWDTLFASITQLNSNITDTLSNNLGAGRVFVAHYLGTKRVLFEEFTNASCDPCAAFNPQWTALVKNFIYDQVIPFVYHVWWPGNTDPMYLYNTAMSQERVNFYGVNAVPHPRVDGFAMPLDTAFIRWAIGLIRSWQSFAFIDVQATQQQDTIFQIQVTAYSQQGDVAAFAENDSVLIFVGLGEEMVSYASPPGTNGETQFPWVARALIPTNKGSYWDGTNDTLTLNFTYIVTDTTGVDLDSLYIVAWIQHKASAGVRLVLNARYAQPTQPTTGIAQQPTNQLPIPFQVWTDNNHLYLHASYEATITQAMITTALGQEIMQLPTRHYQSGEQTAISIAHLPTGIYHLYIQTTDGHQWIWRFRK